MRQPPLALLACVALLASRAASAQGTGPSAGSWEFTLGPVYAFSKQIGFKEGSTVDLASNTGGRLGFAFYMTDEFSVGGDFGYSRANFNATVVGDTASGQPPTTVAIENGRTEFSTFNLTAAYHLLDGPIRPFGLLGLGYNWVHTNIATAPPQTGCWWDPWYGYICTTYQPTHGEGSLTYQVGAGVQFNFSEQLGVNVDYRETWIELHNANGTPGFGTVEAMFIWRFGGGYD
jgi:opacity protein-like surface antigen